jgi:hypothetical protein
MAVPELASIHTHLMMGESNNTVGRPWQHFANKKRNPAGAKAIALPKGERRAIIMVMGQSPRMVPAGCEMSTSRYYLVLYCPRETDREKLLLV